MSVSTQGDLSSTYEVVTGAVAIPSPIAGEPSKLVPPDRYLATGKTGDIVAKEVTGSKTALKLLGQGGTQLVFEHPTKPNKAIKVYDGNRINRVAQNFRNNRVQMGKLSKDPKVIADGEAAQRSLDQLAAATPKGKPYAVTIDQNIAKLIVRQKALGPSLRHQVLPQIKIPRADGRGLVKITMIDGLENVSKKGTTEVELMRLGPVNPNDPNSDIWIDAEDYANQRPDSAGDIRRVGQAWRRQLAPFSERAKDANYAIGIDLLKNVGNEVEEIGYDLGIRDAPLDNTYVRINSKGEVVEIKVADF